MLLATLLLLGCNTDTGARGPRASWKLGKWNLYWWANASAGERTWLIESAGEHVTQLRGVLRGDPVHETDVRFYRTRQALGVARAVVASAHGTTPAMHSSGFGAGIGFLEPWSRTVHIWAGPKLEADQLTHCMLHAVLGPSHADARFASLPLDDYLLSLSIAGRR